MLRYSSVPAILLLLISLHCHAQVYSIGIHAGGYTYTKLCAIDFAFPPHKFGLTEVHGEAVSPSAVEVECGSEMFFVPLDATSPKKVRGGDSIPVKKGSGDLGRLVIECVTNRGGWVTTNALSAFQTSWIRQSRTNQEIIVVNGDHFAEVQKCLEQAYGKPDEGIRSAAPSVNARSLTYTPEQIGIVLNLTSSWRLTIISVIDADAPE